MTIYVIIVEPISELENKAMSRQKFTVIHDRWTIYYMAERLHIVYETLFERTRKTFVSKSVTIYGFKKGNSERL